MTPLTPLETLIGKGIGRTGEPPAAPPQRAVIASYQAERLHSPIDYYRVRCGMHLRESDLLFEFIAPETTRPLSTVLWGEIVVSTHTCTGMPLIRHATGGGPRNQLKYHNSSR